MDLVNAYFPDLSETQKAQFEALAPLYQEWNERINVISRQDIEHLEVHHVLHSLAISKAFRFVPDTQLLDLGTGGGFPGIPLAILFPEVSFLLVDGTGKKIRVVEAVAEALGLRNVQSQHARVEEIKTTTRFDFVLSRGVAPLLQLLQWSQRLIAKKHRNPYPNGIIALKGGDLSLEITALPGKGTDYTEIFPISAYFHEPFFVEKSVVYVQA